jgi:hypothetical protein
VNFADYQADRRKQLTEGALGLLRQAERPLTASQLRVMLDAGMRELDAVLQTLRTAGLIQTHRRKWSLVP